MEKEKNHILSEPKTVFNRVANAVKWTASFFVWPTTKTQLRTFLACALAVGPLSGMLFPTIEDELNKEGVDEQVLTDLGVKQGQNIYVRKFNAVGYGHIALSQPNLFAMAFFANKKKGTKAFSQHFDKYNIKTWFSPTIGCRVTMPVDKPNLWKKTGFTPQEEYLLTLFHEIRHCTQSSQKFSEYMREVDADYHATLQLSKRSDDPDGFVQKTLYTESFSTQKTGHNSVLYLDAKFNGTKIPTESEMKEANQVLTDMLKSGKIILSSDQPWHIHRRIKLRYKAMLALYPNGMRVIVKSSPNDPSPPPPSNHLSHSK